MPWPATPATRGRGQASPRLALGGARALPRAAARGAEEGVQDLHVGHGVLERHRGRTAGADGLRELRGLQGVLIADLEAGRLHARTEDVATVVEEDPRGPVGRRV